MAFTEKIDYVGLAADGLELRSNSQNASNSVLEIPGSDGSILGTEITGKIKAPSCGYAITKAIQLSADLGRVYGGDNVPEGYGKFALSRVQVSTGAGQEPTVEADSVQIEANATRSICVYPTSTLSLSPARHALTFGAFTFTESASLALQTCEYEASVELTPATINNTPVASDSTSGRETVSVTMWSSSENNPPAVTIANGWEKTSEWTCVGADASMFVWTCTLTRYLTANEN